MQVELFRALQSIKVADEQAASVVAHLEAFVVKKVEDANKELVAQLKAQTWVIGSLGAVIAVFGFIIPAVTAIFK